MGWLIAIAIVLGILYLLIVHIIIPFVLPAAGFIAIVSLIGAAIYGFAKSIQGFGSSFVANLNPYRTYADKSPEAPMGVSRNYFFGPGLHQIKATIKDALGVFTK